MPNGSHSAIPDVGDDAPDRQAGEGYETRDPYPERLHAFPLLQGRLDRSMIAVHGFLEGFDLLAYLGVNAAADGDGCVEMADLLGLAV